MSAAPQAAATGPSTARLLAEGARRANAGDTVGALESFGAILAGDPDNFDAINNIGVVFCSAGRPEEGRPYLEKALALAPADGDVRGNLVLVYDTLLRDYLGRNDLASCIDVLRRHLALEPPDSGRLRLNLMDLLCRAGQRAELSDFAPGMTPEVLGRHILIACMPKSGSSLLKETLRLLTGWKESHFSFAFMRNEQELHLPAMLECAGSDTVTQQHCRATQANVQLIQAFGIRPIILVRNIHDIVVSLTDFYDAGAVYNSFLSNHWRALDPAARTDAVIAHVVPWYLSFYASWTEACAADQVEALLIRYEDLIADKPGTIAAIADFLRLGKRRDECATAISAAEGDRTATRKNRGVAGRGAAALSGDQKDHIARLAASYVNTDFSPIGI